MCCLAYEDEYYADACKKVPKLGATVATPEGKGQVVSVNMLKMEVRVKIEKDGALLYRDFAAEDVSRAEPDRGEPVRREQEETDAPEAAQQPARAEKRERPDRGEKRERPPREHGGDKRPRPAPKNGEGGARTKQHPDFRTRRGGRKRQPPEKN